MQAVVALFYMYGLLSSKDVVYKVPVDVIKTEMIKLLRKAGE